jgi:methylase of polypeptide subunit release factors
VEEEDMISVTDVSIHDVPVDEWWNFGEKKEKLMHNLHAYPAKFPAFIASKAFDYAKAEGVKVNTVSDIFCGCGTVALEAKLRGMNFWGCDINPVATLIAKSKSNSYKKKKLEYYYTKIKKCIADVRVADSIYKNSNQRLQYWFNEASYLELYKIKTAIEGCVPRGKYREVFLCLFSSILKPASRWLSKSIKPHIDLNKKTTNIVKMFELQYKKLIKSFDEIDNFSVNCKIEVNNKNILTIRKLPKVDLLITSPPYVTSYEYADLHQLSSLWLGFTEDYRSLRSGTIGSTYNNEKMELKLQLLNGVGQRIIWQLQNNNEASSMVRSVSKYYLDMQKVVTRCKEMINENGMVIFVVGDTEYKGVKVMNSEHLIEALKENGFLDIKISKRQISNKLLPSYRDEKGRFSSDKTQRTIYSEELIISGRV